jgi:sulfonate transport system permease protein
MAKTSQRSTSRSWQSKLQRSRWVSPIALMLAWEAASRIGLIPTRTLAAPSQVLGTLWGMIVSGELPANLAVSLGRAAAGLVIGVSLGIVLALVAGLTREGEAAVDSPVQMLRTLPALALSPLFIVWFGIGETPQDSADRVRDAVSGLSQSL